MKTSARQLAVPADDHELCTWLESVEAVCVGEFTRGHGSLRRTWSVYEGVGPRCVLGDDPPTFTSKEDIRLRVVNTWESLRTDSGE